MADKIPTEPLQLLADSTLTDPAKPAMTWPIMSGGEQIGWSGSYYDVARELAREMLTLRADLAQARADLEAAQASAAIRQTTINEAHLVLDEADIDRESADGHTLPLWDRVADLMHYVRTVESERDAARTGRGPA